MNRRQKIIVSVTGIFLVLLILVGLTYAYFLTQIEGNPNTKSISVTTANLALTYGDGTTALLTSSEPIIPGEFTASKDFTVTNNGNATVEDYGVVIEDFSIKYATTTDKVTKDDKTYMVYPDDMKLTLTCTSDKGNTCTGITDGTLPTTNDILVTNTIEKDETQTYTLTLTYEDSGIDQSADMNKTIEGKINIIDTHSTVDLTGTVSNHASGDYVQTNSTPRVASIDKNGNYKVVGLEPGTHTVRLFSKTGEEKGSKEINIVKGETAGISGNTITITDDSRKFNIDINATSESYTLGDTVTDFSLFKLGSLAYKVYTNGADIQYITSPGTFVEDPTCGYGQECLDNVASGCPGECYAPGSATYDSKNVKDIKTIESFSTKADGTSWSDELNTFTNDGLFTAVDDYGDSYYFRGPVINNYVSFAGFTWRIVRINGDGSVRLVLDLPLDKASHNGTLVKTNSALYAIDSDGMVLFNSAANDNAYIGYMYGATGQTTYDATHENKNSSIIKNYVDTFYREYLLEYKQYLADNLFCGDKTRAEGYSTKGTGTVSTYYNVAERLIPYNTTPTPTFECAASKNDTDTLTEEQRAYSRYTSKMDMTTTTPKGVLVNNDLTYPIALLSADEIMMAGAHSQYYNTSYYLADIYKKQQYYTQIATMSSILLEGNYLYRIIMGFGNKSLESTTGHYADSFGVRPVINLRADLKVIGDGTENNPYRVK